MPLRPVLSCLALALAACRAPAPAPDDGGPVDRDRIVPVVKSRTWLASAAQELGGSDRMPAWDPVGPDLCVVYGEDRPASVRILSEAQVRALGLSRDDLRTLAGRNLGAVVPELRIRGGEGVYVVEAGGVYESSMIFWAGLWSGRLKVKGDPVVAVPARDVLLVTGSEDPKGLARLREVAARAFAESPHPLTSILLVRRGQRLEPFAPPRAHRD